MEFDCSNKFDFCLLFWISKLAMTNFECNCQIVEVTVKNEKIYTKHHSEGLLLELWKDAIVIGHSL